MSFADNYLSKQNYDIPLIASDLIFDAIIVIPAHNEPNIKDTLKSLEKCTNYNLNVGVVIIFNASEDDSLDIKKMNKETLTLVEAFANTNKKRQYFCFNYPALRSKDAGAGYARKIGMDISCKYFNCLNKPENFIISLDADCIVSENYLTEIENTFNKETDVFTIAFKHQKAENPAIQKAIDLYELHLRYYYQAAKHIGFPYVSHTIGSCFGINALTYSKQGGMNKKKAGEDFYFLQKTIPIGHFREIKKAKVMPSSRISNRVPFGTGPELQKIISSEIKNYRTYNLKSFFDLKTFFEIYLDLYKINEDNFNELLRVIPVPVKEFLQESYFFQELSHLNNNCNSIETFKNRFFTIFNAFKIVKYLNYTHNKYYDRKDVINEASVLLSYIGINASPDLNSLLFAYEKLEGIN